MLLANQTQPYTKLIGKCYGTFKPLGLKLLPLYLVLLVTLGGFYRFIIAPLFTHLASTWITADANGNLQISFLQMKQGMAWTLALASFGGITIYLYFANALFYRTDGILLEDHHKIQGAWKAGLQRWLPAIGYTLVIFVIFSGLSILNFLVEGRIHSHWLLMALYSVVFLVSLILFIRLSYGYALLVSRHQNIFSAISQSLYLTKGYFWRLLGMYILTVSLPTLAFCFLGMLLNFLLPIGILGSITLLILSIVGHYVVTVLMIGSLYVFLNDSALHHRETT